MDKDKTKASERLLYMEKKIRTELDDLREIRLLLAGSWQDPGGDLIDRELAKHIQALEEQAAELRKQSTLSDEEQGAGDERQAGM